MKPALLLFAGTLLLSCVSTDELQRTGGGAAVWIEVVPMGVVSERTLSAVVSAVEDGFGIDARLSAPIRDISAAFDTERKQFRAAVLLEMLKERSGAASLRRIGVLEEDIYIEGRKYVFGVASEGAGCCLVSLLRLSGRFWGMGEDAELFALRTRKLVLHELGHLFGLKHCRGGCVMAFANSLVELDRLSDDFCSDCAEKLEEALREMR